MSSSKVINPVIKATQNIFREWFDTEIERTGLQILDTRHYSQTWEYSAVIGISGLSKGIVVISVSKKLAVQLLKRMTDSANVSSATDEDITMVFSEVANLISGNASGDPIFDELKLSISLPSVVKGPDHQFSWPPQIPILMIPFTSSIGDFVVFFGLENQITGSTA
jgi:chemotaxis protein CheX